MKFGRVCVTEKPFAERMSELFHPLSDACAILHQSSLSLPLTLSTPPFHEPHLAHALYFRRLLFSPLSIFPLSLGPSIIEAIYSCSKVHVHTRDINHGNFPQRSDIVMHLDRSGLIRLMNAAIGGTHCVLKIYLLENKMNKIFALF